MILCTCHTSAPRPTTDPSSTSPQLPPPALHLSHIQATLDVDDLKDMVTLHGSVELQGALTSRGGVLVLDAIDFRDVSVVAQPELLRARHHGEQIVLEWPPSPHTSFVATLVYEVTPTKGLAHTDTDIWTTFHTWRWLPVEQSPGQRATLSLDVRMAPAWSVTTTTLARTVPHPAYTYGFHATRRLLAEDTQRAHGEDVLRVRGTPEHQRVLDRTSAALTRWKSVMGEEWMPTTYTQIFVPGRAAQEAAGLSFLSMEHASGLVTTPDEDWLIVHELAHQEWGNLVTCKTWGDFWINEAFVVWWVYRDRVIRGDSTSAEREFELWRSRTSRALERGDDSRIHRPGVSHDDAGGPIVYNAGALVLHALTEELGEHAVDTTLRALLERARTARGLSLATAEFLDAFELSATQRARIEGMLADARLVL